MKLAILQKLNVHQQQKNIFSKSTVAVEKHYKLYEIHCT